MLKIVGNSQSQTQPQQSQLESQESLVQAQLVDESDRLSHSSSSRKQKIKQVSKSISDYIEVQNSAYDMLFLFAISVCKT